MVVWYGYELETEGSTRRMVALRELNEGIPEPFALQFLQDGETVRAVLGFAAVDLETVVELAEELRDWRSETPLLDDVEMDRMAYFYGGVPCVPEVESDSSDESESDGSDESEGSYVSYESEI